MSVIETAKKADHTGSAKYVTDECIDLDELCPKGLYHFSSGVTPTTCRLTYIKDILAYMYEKQFLC